MWNYIFNFIVFNIGVFVDGNKIVLVIKEFSCEPLYVYLIRGEK
jgi:hypothetical protein